MAKDISAIQAAKLLGISPEDIKVLEKQEVLKATRHKGKLAFFSLDDIERIKSHKKLTIAEEAEQVGARLQQDLATSLLFIKKIIFIAGIGVVGYYLLVGILTILFILFPLQTATWLGYAPRTQLLFSAKPEVPNNKVLGVATDTITENPISAMNIILKPVSKNSLDIVKYANPETYAEIGKIVILDVNDVINLDEKGSLTPLQAVKFSQSDLLEMTDSGLVENLNSQYLQNLEPGTDIGDIAIIGSIPIAGLTVTNFDSSNISQWTNDAGFIISSSNNTLTNKTIAAGSNTISGLTNSNLSGSAGITNANLANSGVTINTSSPLTGGGLIALGDTITLRCPTCTTSSGDLFTFAASSGSDSTISQGDTLTLTAGSNITTTNDGNGAITIALSSTPTVTSINGLTITANGSNTLNIASGKTLTISNSLTFAGTDGTTLTFPGSSDTIVGLTSGQTLTNKTIAAGSNTISGLTNSNLSGSAGITNANLANSSIIVSTGTGLSGGATIALGDTLSLSNNGVTSLTGTANQVNTSGSTGAITLSLPQSIATTSNPTFASINGLSLTSASDGFTIAGGTTSRTLTVTGADVTIGSTIKPTSTGTLTIQSNGASALGIDAGGAAAITIGTTNASALTIGRSGVTTTVNGIGDVNNLKIGSGTTITKHLSATATFDAANVGALSCSDIGTITVTGASTGDTAVGTPTPVSGGIETLTLTWNAYVSSSDTVTIRACNIVSILGQNPASQTWRADVWQH